MREYRLLLFGPPQIESNKQVTQTTLRKTVALAAYLAVEQRAFSREYLAALLWPNLGQRSALANLRRTLSLLRRTFGNECIVTEGDQVQLNRTFITVDIDEFHSLSCPQSSETDLARLEAAAELYRGSFLEGFNLGDCEEFDEWQDAVRERLRSEFDTLLETLGRGYLQMNRPKLALPLVRRWLELDQWNEAAHRALMEIYKRMGRPDLARHQYESCVRALERDGLEPDDLTRDLNDTIAENHHTSRAGVEWNTPAGEDRSAEIGTGPGARRKRWLMYAGIAALVVVIIGTVGGVGGFFSRSDFMVTSAQVLQTGDELSAVRIVFRNEGVGRTKAGYSVVFSPDPVVGAASEFLVYSSEVRIDSNRDAIVVVDGVTDIQEFVDRNGVRIPPGTYRLAVVVDPRTRSREDAEHNNYLASKDRFFYAGAADVEVLKVEITYNGEDSLDDANPIKVFIGDRTRYDRPGDWGRFRVPADGQYYFPLDGVPRRDNDESGYFMLFVHDAGDDLKHLPGVDQDDVAGIYRDGPNSLMYGSITVLSGSPVYPGSFHTVSFSIPSPPAADIYEAEEFGDFGTVVDYAELPIRQYHTFHPMADGESDRDWFRIFLRTGDKVTLETLSANGSWEADTQIDLCDSSFNYIRSNRDKSPGDSHSELTYVNDTGIDQVFCFLVKPSDRTNSFAYFQTGEYVVEIRR